MLIKGLTDEINRYCIRLDCDSFLTKKDRQELIDKVCDLVEKRDKITKASQRDSQDNEETVPCLTEKTP